MAVHSSILQECILEHHEFWQELPWLGIAEVRLMPALDIVFDFKHGAGEKFGDILQVLTRNSDYAKLAIVPIALIGYLPVASYHWHFAAGNPTTPATCLPQAARHGSQRAAHYCLGSYFRCQLTGALPRTQSPHKGTKEPKPLLPRPIIATMPRKLFTTLLPAISSLIHCGSPTAYT